MFPEVWNINFLSRSTDSIFSRFSELVIPKNQRMFERIEVQYTNKHLVEATFSYFRLRVNRPPTFAPEMCSSGFDSSTTISESTSSPSFISVSLPTSNFTTSRSSGLSNGSFRMAFVFLLLCLIVSRRCVGTR
jgi:hypothetical protein